MYLKTNFLSLFGKLSSISSLYFFEIVNYSLLNILSFYHLYYLFFCKHGCFFNIPRKSLQLLLFFFFFLFPALFHLPPEFMVVKLCLFLRVLYFFQNFFMHPLQELNLILNLEYIRIPLHYKMEG